MKRSISIILVVAMLVSAIAFSIPTNAAAAVNIDYVEAKYFAAAPTIDGYISEAEWGEYTVMVEATDCETKDGESPYKCFLYWRTGERSKYNKWYYYLWLRWDHNYFYIGLKNYDPDRHSLKNGTTDTWNGDALQTRIDPAGPNAVVQGQEFYVTSTMKKPWSNDDTVPDFVFGYVEIAGGFSEAWENTTNRGMTRYSSNPLGDTYAVIAPAGSSYSSDTSSGITTYEIAIPWAYMGIQDGNELVTALDYSQYVPDSNAAGGIGRAFGMSLVVLDDGANPDAQWDAFMTWGSGICNAQQEEGAKTCTGSNCVTLVEESVTPKTGYRTYDPTNLLDAKYSTADRDPQNVYYDYMAGDINKDYAHTYDQLSVLTYTYKEHLSIWGASEYNGKITNIGGIHGNVLDYRSTDPVQTYIDTRDGSNRLLVPTNYTLQFDICYTGNEITLDKYAPAIYNWFGGSGGTSFRCGYFFDDNEFRIVREIGANSESPEIIARADYDLKKDNWYTWRFQFDNKSCTARLWIDDLSTTEDNRDNDWGELILNSRYRYYYYSGDALYNGTLLAFRQINTQLMYDNVRIYNFASNADINESLARCVNIEDISVIENTCGHEDENGNYIYSDLTPSFNVVLNDGSVVQSDDYGVEIDGERHYLDIDIDDQYNGNYWKAGNTYRVTGSILGVKGAFNVEIVENPITSIEVIKAPDKTLYTVGEYFNLKGAKLRLHFNDGAYEDISIQYSCGGYLNQYSRYYSSKLQSFSSIECDRMFGQSGRQSVKIRLFGKTFEYEVDVTDNLWQSISIKNGADKSLVITANSSDGIKTDMKVLDVDFWDSDSIDGGVYISGAIITDKGIYNGVMYFMDDGSISVELYWYDSNDNLTVLSGNTLTECDWLTANLTIQFLYPVWAVPLTEFRGIITSDNIDSIATIAIYTLDSYLFENSYITYTDTCYKIDGEALRNIISAIFAVDDVDLSLSEYYDVQTDSYYWYDEYGNGTYIHIVPMEIYYADGRWNVRAVTVNGTGEIADTYIMKLDDDFRITMVGLDFIIGDANSDGKVNGIDVNYMKRALGGTYDVNIAMDINGDGKVNGTDVNLLKRYLVGSYVI